jgi:hypothetical protein
MLRPYRNLEGITRTKDGYKVKELFYIAANDKHPRPGIIGLCWRGHAYRDTVWDEETGLMRFSSSPAFAIDLPPVVTHTDESLLTA